jgi:hypothetical protein
LNGNQRPGLLPVRKFATYDDRARALDISYSGWLTWAVSAAKVAARGETLGQTSKNALNWEHKSFLHGQIDADQKEHWYRMVLPSKATIELSAWGEKDSNLDLALYRPGQVDSPLASNVEVGDLYPTKVTFTIPSSADRAEVLLKISNPGKSNTEYTVSYIKK